MILCIKNATILSSYRQECDLGVHALFVFQLCLLSTFDNITKVKPLKEGCNVLPSTSLKVVNHYFLTNEFLFKYKPIYPRNR